MIQVPEGRPNAHAHSLADLYSPAVTVAGFALPAQNRAPKLTVNAARQMTDNCTCVHRASGPAKGSRYARYNSQAIRAEPWACSQSPIHSSAGTRITRS